jgi:spoIIIJ-associated protein
VEWVEVTGKTVEEATEQALDRLGVASDDAEVIVVNEAKMGLFGRVREEARVRARVRPIGARPKRDRSRRGGRSGGSSRQRAPRAPKESTSHKENTSNTSNTSNTFNKEKAAEAKDGGAVQAGSGQTASAANGSEKPAAAGSGTGTSRSARRRRNRGKTAAGVGADEGGQNGSTSGSAAPRASRSSSELKENVDMAEGMTLEEQGEIGREFLAGLLSEYGMAGSVETRLIDEETVEIAAVGDDLGMLVGPRGSTLSALQDLTRAVVQRRCPSRTDRILVDVAGYRERRSAALKRFSVQIAEEVLESGQEKALEAMSPADRKAVHDAVNEMNGVVTRSEGEDPNRFVVISPAG